MTITNRLGLPDAMVKACGTTAHNKAGSISATTLLKGVKEVILTNRHWEELTDDVADRVWAIFGTAVHSMLEHDSPDTFAEEYVSLDVSGMKVTGRIDCYNMKAAVIEDYKTASCWKVVYNDFSDWYNQGMIYAYLMRKNGFEVKRCRFIAMLKDWSKSKAKFDTAYPQCPVHVYQFDVTEKGLLDIKKFITEKVNAVKMCEVLPDDEISECTKEERWAKDDVYAVMKNGRKSAIKLYNNEPEAIARAEEEKGFVEKREAKSTKCLEYCSCCDFCHFYKTIKSEELNG